MFVSINKFIIFLISVLLLTACGGGNNDSQLPPSATIDIVTLDQNWDATVVRDENDNCLYDATRFIDEPVLVSVQDGQGRALGNVNLHFSLALAGNTFSGMPVVELYDDRNGNGVPDSPAELVSDNTDGLFETKTDKRDGSAFVIVRMNISCPYRSVLTVFGPGLAADIDLEVTEDKTIIINSETGEIIPQ